MKVINVCARYYPYVGGVETILKETSERLVDKGFNVNIFTTDPSGKLMNEEVINGVKVVRYKSLAPSGAYFLPYPGLFRDVVKEKTDILHVHNLHALTTFVAYLAFKMVKQSKFVISPYYHGHGQTWLSDKLWIPYRPFIRKLLNNSNGILVNSKVQENLVKKTFNPLSNFYIVHEGANINIIARAEPFKFNDHRKILLYVGRLVKYKNIDIAIKAVEKLPKNYHLYIIGRGSERPHLERLIESLRVQDRVHLLDFQPNEMVYRWLKTSDIFLHLSSVETFGLTCIESLASKTPVIANDDNYGLSETINMFPKQIFVYRVKREPISRLVDLIIKIIDLKEINPNVSNFSWNFIVDRLVSVYEKILMN